MSHQKLARFWIAVIVLVLAACQAQSSPQPTSPAAPEKVSSDLSVISASGEVVPARFIQLTFAASGSLQALHVEAGDTVKAGQELALIGGDALKNSLVQADANVKQAQATLQALQEPASESQIQQAELAIEVAKQALEDLQNPTDLAIAQAEIAIVDAKDAAEDAKRVKDNLQYVRGSEEKINTARADYLLAQEQVDRLQEIYNNTAGDPEVDVQKANALSNLSAAKAVRDRAKRNLDWYLGEPSQKDVDQKTAEYNLAVARLADAQDWLETLRNPSALDIRLAEANVASAEQTLKDLLAGPADYQIAAAQAQLAAAEQTLVLLNTQSVLVAPFAGVVVETYVQAGDNLSPATPVLLLADLGNLQVETTDLSELDVVRLKVGDTARVSFDALPDVSIAGNIEKIADKAAPGANVTFQVVLSLDEIPEGLRWGMTAFVTFDVKK